MLSRGSRHTRSFVVNINSSVSDQFPLHQRVFQGSVLSPLLFILCTAPSPSALLSLSQHVVIIFMLMTLNYSFPSLLQISLPTSYAYKRQLTVFPTNILSLNQAKSEFLLISLHAQLSKIAEPNLLMPSNVTI